MQQQGLEVTMERAARVYWAYFWRTTVFSIALAIVLGIVMRAIAGDAEPTKSASFFSMLVGFAIGVYVSIVMMRKTLKKEYKDFQIVLLPRQLGTLERNHGTE